LWIAGLSTAHRARHPNVIPQRLLRDPGEIVNRLQATWVHVPDAPEH
jgi:hypothetical protein